jgi:hypothetical protein
MQRRIDRALRKAERPVAALAQALDQRVPVPGAALQLREQKQVEISLDGLDT